MTESVVVVDGVVLDPPLSLSPTEVDRLAGYNTARNKGQLYDEATTEQMDVLQLRFDWLGYFSDDGEHHGGPGARPAIVQTRPHRVWWLSRA